MAGYNYPIPLSLYHENDFTVSRQEMLDTINQAQIWETILEVVRQRKIGMLVVSHELPLLERICDRILSFEELTKK